MDRWSTSPALACRSSASISTKQPAGTLSKNNVSNEFDKLQRRLEIKRSRRSFYAIRYTWRTVADRCRDASN